MKNYHCQSLCTGKDLREKGKLSYRYCHQPKHSLVTSRALGSPGRYLEMYPDISYALYRSLRREPELCRAPSRARGREERSLPAFLLQSAGAWQSKSRNFILSRHSP